jgi:DNA-binding NtrC family response regulator
MVIGRSGHRQAALRAVHRTMPTRRRGHVLVVDDDAGVSEFLTRALEQLGIAVTPCRGVEGVEQVTKDVRFNLIVTSVVPRVEPLAVSLATIHSHYPDTPLLHLSEVHPLSIEKLSEVVLHRMRTNRH